MNPKLPIQCLLIGVLFFPTISFSQANLIVTQSNYSPASISKGDMLTVVVSIKNDGNVSAGQTFMFFYFSTDINFSDDEIISRVSVKPLSPGETATVNIVYPIPPPINNGTYYLGCKVDAYNYVNETNENNIFYHPNKFTILNSIVSSQKIPYPIIFVHGLVGDSYTWNTFANDLSLFYGFTYGGNMNFCLNYDGNASNSNFTNDYKDFTNLSNLIPGDYYYVNFDVDANGNAYFGDANNPIASNQSAIFKQGRALKDAIKHVLQKTGRDKVVLVGHSMGGLAAREYLQNSNIWQSDGKHHVAKLLTIGTPHGGSNSSFLGIGLNGVNELSEAVRDLRTSYYTGYSGCYLFGGVESITQIDGAIYPFVNIDVNCNGSIGQTITGLNQKNYPVNIANACIIGYGSLLGGDAVVSETSANLNNWFALDADTFRYKEFVDLPATLHTVLHKRTPLVMKGIDEPNEYNQSYDIEFNKLYFGFSSIQPENGYDVDYDDYKVVVNQSGKLNVTVSNIPVAAFKINILNLSEQILTSQQSSGKSNLEKEIQLTPGTYFVEFETEWTNFSYRFPYAFKVDFTPTVSTDDPLEITFESKLVPNPAINDATLFYSLNELDDIEIIICDITGRVFNVINPDNGIIGENSINLDFTSMSSGIYTFTIKGSKMIETKSFVVNK